MMIPVQADIKDFMLGKVVLHFFAHHQFFYFSVTSLYVRLYCRSPTFYIKLNCNFNSDSQMFNFIHSIVCDTALVFTRCFRNPNCAGIICGYMIISVFKTGGYQHQKLLIS